jgi:hypothetical protein
MVLKKPKCEGVDWTQIVVSSEHDNEPMRSVTDHEFIDLTRDC